VVTGEVVGTDREDGGFTVALADGRTVRARRLLVAQIGAVAAIPPPSRPGEGGSRGVNACLGGG